MLNLQILGSSVGISKATDRDSLIEAVDFALKFDRRVIVEQGVTAREIELGVKGNDDPTCSVPGEIKPVTDFYDYEAKYKDGNTELIIPAAVTQKWQKRWKTWQFVHLKYSIVQDLYVQISL